MRIGRLLGFCPEQLRLYQRAWPQPLQRPEDFYGYGGFSGFRLVNSAGGDAGGVSVIQRPLKLRGFGVLAQSVKLGAKI